MCLFLLEQMLANVLRTASLTEVPSNRGLFTQHRLECRRAMPNCEMTVELIMSEVDEVAFCVSFHGLHKGELICNLQQARNRSA
jgi:predicted ester cyclase